MNLCTRLKGRFFLTFLMLIGYGVTGCDRAQEEKSQVSIDGAAVGFPISLAVAEEYEKVKPEAKVSVASSGTGGGISKFCAGDIDIVGASRTIRDEEIERCKSKNIEFVELPIGLDGIAVIANRQNNFAKCLTIKELDKMWSAKSDGKVLSWKQINPKFPDKPLKLYAPASDTGTFDYFTQAVTKKAKNGRTDYTPSHNQNLLVQGVSGEESALGYVGISYYIQNQDKLNLVAVKGPTGKCEKPVPIDNVVKNIYTPLSRPLFIYVSKKSIDNKPAVKEFVDFYLENSWKWVDSVGYVALPDEAYVKTKRKFAAGETGTKFKKAKPGEPITNFI
ncbi:PstS family phosphate ABC transporter substrate-binding protein [Chlorogloeopsis sp. ULAP01]|uniref:PstS family phosphate ABC transporter substrate-binding protein n=1 Tax=Chlorogloeopsis sp. ULAP01 TaxID=3056483 RepID=UPI0025AAAA59|nr:PstS family phosphate ABC transporter substrate-binding protein [Chlorogloeopsis sp. ULAP01]MDM9384110.1 PstS family phosphate ABC transporter substrate-binding protein [Chlorogloeopsis sp. ULAP01]